MSIFAKWFCPQEKKPETSHKVCTECHVHFEPVKSYALGEAEFSNLCKKCREPKLALYRREHEVLSWAKRNWKKLEKRALADNAKYAKKAQEAGLHDAARMFGLQQNTAFGTTRYDYYPGRYEWCGTSKEGAKRL